MNIKLESANSSHTTANSYQTTLGHTPKYNIHQPFKDETQTVFIRPSSYRAVNTFHLGYKNQSVYAVSGTGRCLSSDKYKTHKYSVGRTYSC